MPNQSLMRTPGALAVEELGPATRRRIACRSAKAMTSKQVCIGFIAFCMCVLCVGLLYFAPRNSEIAPGFWIRESRGTGIRLLCDQHGSVLIGQELLSYKVDERSIKGIFRPSVRAGSIWQYLVERDTCRVHISTNMHASILPIPPQ